MIRIGLTGGIGSGKSIVARMFGVLGVPVLEADKEARKLMEHDPELKAMVSGRFGNSIYPDGVLDRKALAAIVFNDPDALQELNAMVHPAVRKAFSSWAVQQKAAYVMMEAAILVETGGHKNFDKIIVVSAPEERRVQRVVQRDGVGEEAVRARMSNQASEQERLAIADFIIINDDRQLVIPQVLEIHEALMAIA